MDYRTARLTALLRKLKLQGAILAGKPGTGMQGYGTILSSQDLSNLVKYLRSLSTSK